MFAEERPALLPLPVEPFRYTVTKVEAAERFMIVHIERLGRRLLRCGVCRQRCRKVHSARKSWEWRDLSEASPGATVAS